MPEPRIHATAPSPARTFTVHPHTDVAYHFTLEEDGTVTQNLPLLPKSLITEPPADAPEAPDEGMVWVNWEHGPAGWEYPEDVAG